MKRINNLNEVRAELERVLAAVDKALNNDRICGIERDIVLERLRDIYEAIQEACPETKADITFKIQAQPVEKQEEETLSEVIESPEELDLVEIRTTQEITYTDDVSGGETTIRIEEETQTTKEELKEHHFGLQPPIAREIIDSLYGDADLCKPSVPTEPEKELDQAPKPEPELLFEKPKEPAATVADTLSQSAKVLNETMGEGPVKDVASMLSSQNAGELRKQIGLNDRFLLMTDIFDNDAGVYERTLDELDRCGCLEDAVIYLYEHFQVDDSKEGVQLLIGLLETKFN